MSKIDDGGPAFPLAVTEETIDHLGMSLRDYFAGQALAGLCANPGGPYQANPMNGWGLVNCDMDGVIDLVYALADAMIRARKETSND